MQRFSEHFEHKIVSCLFCGFVYVGNTPSQKYYDNYYREQSKYEGIRQHEAHDKSTHKALKYILKKYISKDADILDVGCSTGKLLYFIKQKGYKNLLGIEPAPECKTIAKQNYGLTIKTSTLDNFKSKKKYNLIVFSQIFEHLIDLRNAVLKSDSLLKDNGIIFIGVPDVENFYKKFDEPFREFSTEHINFFSRKSLFFLLSKFENIFMKSNGNFLSSLWRKSSQNNSYIDKYIAKSNSKMKKVLRTIKLLPNNTIVWGTGLLTQKLLKTTNLKMKIFKFIDSNKNLIGKKINGIEILSPNELIKYNNPILISSFGFRDEILGEINKRNIKNKIITFK